MKQLEIAFTQTERRDLDNFKVTKRPPFVYLIDKTGRSTTIWLLETLASIKNDFGV
jgi:hypothetical protein